jgi:hypothetical protein
LSAGLLESSTRLKPHEAQSYRKKTLWVSWVSIVVTLILAVAAFSKSATLYAHWDRGRSFYLLPILHSITSKMCGNG